MVNDRWRLLPRAAPAFQAALADLPPLLVDLLYNRLPGTAPDPAGARAFLDPTLRLDGDPFLLPDMQRAVLRLREALRGDELIAIYGDYDVDGVSGTALLTEGLAAYGARVLPYIPHRVSEGYGVNHGALASLRAQGATLVITVDTGIAAVEEVSRALANGLEVIVTDHHMPGAALPPTQAVINPRRRDSAYPYPELAGTGVAYKLLQALWEATPRAKHAPSDERALELVALGTVADVVPLIGENRSLVRAGLRALNGTERPGLQALMASAGLRRGEATAEGIGWLLAPRLNAAGRLDHADRALRLLLASEPSEAELLASELEALNRERQRLTRRVVEEARALVDPAGEGLCWAGGPEFPAGVVGLAAARLAEETGRPAVVLEIGEETATASLRSVPEFDLAAALQTCAAEAGQSAPLFVRFGGHRQAAGFTARVEQLPEIRARLGDLARKALGHLPMGPRLVVDAEAAPQEWSGGAVKWLEALEPVGAGNPAPQFLARDLELLEAKPMGNGGEHLRLRLRNQHGAWSAVAFGLGPRRGELTNRLDIVYYWSRDDYFGQPLLGLAVRDFVPAGLAQGRLSLSDER